MEVGKVMLQVVVVHGLEGAEVTHVSVPIRYPLAAGQVVGVAAPVQDLLAILTLLPLIGLQVVGVGWQVAEVLNPGIGMEACGDSNGGEEG